MSNGESDKPSEAFDLEAYLTKHAGKPVLCGTCQNKMMVPGSAHIECAWRRKSTAHVWFYEGFNPNYPVPVFECEGYKEGPPFWTEETA